MADEEHAQEDKTEAPSAGRIKQAREEGNVPLGRDLVTLSGLAAGGLTLVLVGKRLLDSLVALVWTSLSRVGESARPGDLVELLKMPALVMLGFAGLVAGAVIVCTVSQTQFGFWPQLAIPKFDKIFSGGKLGKFFDKEKLADVGVNLVKIVTISAVLWMSFRDEFVTLPKMLHLGPDGLMAAMFGPIGKAKVLLVLLMLAGADLALTRYRFTGRLKMTKEEIKREYKEEEGDPMYKGQRKRRHRELIRGGNFAKEIPQADVVVVNPTHIAVALRYRPGEDKAPKLTAKGKGVKAENIRDLARQHGIPIVENIALARLLFKKVKVGRSVPAETFKAVAAILAFVYKTMGRSGNGASASRSNQVSL